MNDSRRHAPLVYGTFSAVTVLGAGLVRRPGAPLVAIMQVLCLR